MGEEALFLSRRERKDGWCERGRIGGSGRMDMGGRMDEWERKDG